MEKKLTLGSLFDGSGGFPLGGLLAGITPVWASEIEPFPIRVTTKRLPFMKHYGNISAMDGSRIEPVDIITFGSPCQDMSVAGRRDGLDGSRSSLFYEAVRIIKEMRCATNGKYPRYIVWENVPGAFSSNKGEDFRRVLEELCKIKRSDTLIPKPPKRGGTHGTMQDLSWETGFQSLGESSMRSFGAYPNAVEESFLWQILEDNVPEKYSLSEKACQGVLRRAERRGKEMPVLLLLALMQKCGMPVKMVTVEFVPQSQETTKTE